MRHFLSGILLLFCSRNIYQERTFVEFHGKFDGNIVAGLARPPYRADPAPDPMPTTPGDTCK